MPTAACTLEVSRHTLPHCTLLLPSLKSLASPASVVFILKVIYGNCKIQLQSKMRAMISLRIQLTASGRFEKGKPLIEKLVLNEARSLRTVLWAVTAKCPGALVDDMSSITQVWLRSSMCARKPLNRTGDGCESQGQGRKPPVPPRRLRWKLPESDYLEGLSSLYISSNWNHKRCINSLVNIRKVTHMQGT